MTIRSLLGDHRTGARTTAYGPAGRRDCSAPAGLHAAARRRRHCSAVLAAPLAAAYTSSSTPPSATRAAWVHYRNWPQHRMVRWSTASPTAPYRVARTPRPLHWMVWRPAVLQTAQTTEPAHAQGCPVPRAGGRAWALETASVPDSIGLPTARCTVGRQVPGAHLPSPGLTICGLAIQVLSRPLGLSLGPGGGHQLASCRSLDQLDWARSRALLLPWLRAELLTGRWSCLAAARAELRVDLPI